MAIICFGYQGVGSKPKQTSNNFKKKHMNKQTRIKSILLSLATSKGLTSILTESKIESLAESLSNLSFATRETVKSKISFGDIIIKESIDFSDTNQWIDMIVDIINE